MYDIKPCSEESVANATASEITTGNITNIALPPVYIATAEQLGGIIVGETLQVDFRGVLNVSKAITDKIADLYTKIGDMTTLTTDEKTTLVDAINEVDAHANAAQQTADTATELANTGISKAETAQSSADEANARLDDAVLVRIESEPVKILTTDWVEDGTIDPFTVKAVKKSTLPLKGNRKRLVAPVFDTLDMARYGLVIGSIETTRLLTTPHESRLKRSRE